MLSFVEIDKVALLGSMSQYLSLSRSWSSYLMYAISAVAMISNDLSRVNRYKAVYSAGDPTLTEERDVKAAMVQTEQMNLYADMVGFSVGLLLIPTLGLL